MAYERQEVVDGITRMNKKLYDNLQDGIEEAVAISKGKNRAHVFSTTEKMKEWLSNVDNRGLYKVGDNLYIVDVGVPDWWVSEVLEEVDTETGYYYKIAQLETQKVDLTEIESMIDSLQDNVDDINETLQVDANNIALNYQTLGYNKKNLLKNTATTQIVGEVTFTVNNDGSVTVNGINGTTGQPYSRAIFVADKDLDVIYSGCPKGGSFATYWQNILDVTDNINYNDVGNGCKISLVKGHTYYHNIYVAKGATVNNVTFYPMIRDARISDDTYEPYVDDIDARIIQINSGLKICRYNSVSDLGLDRATVTLADIINALPNNSEVYLAINTQIDTSIEVPVIGTGTLHVLKSITNGTRILVEYITVMGIIYTKGYTNNALTDNWEKITVSSDILTFTDKVVSINSWLESGRSGGYNYYADIPCDRVTSGHIPNVYFTMADSISGNFAPVCESFDGKVIIYAKEVPTADITIPAIQCIRSIL